MPWYDGIRSLLLSRNCALKKLKLYRARRETWDRYMTFLTMSDVIEGVIMINQELKDFLEKYKIANKSVVIMKSTLTSLYFFRVETYVISLSG